MAVIGPSITISSAGPGGTREIGFSNFFVSGQSPFGIDGTWQICDSFTKFLRLYGGLTKLASVASGTTADTVTSETNAAVTMPYNAVKAYFLEKQQGSPGVVYFCRTVASSSGPTAATKNFPDNVGTNNTVVTAKSKGFLGGTVQATWINPSPRAGILTLLAGTVTVSSGSASVTGTGTSFVTGSTWVGWGIKIGTEYYTILSVASTTALTLASAAISTHTADTASVGNNITTAYVKLQCPILNITEEWDISNANDAANASKKSELATIVLPAGGQLPSSLTASKLQSGTVATADAYAATTADLVGTTTVSGVKTGLQVFNDQRLGTGFVAIPGKYDSTARSGIATHCASFLRLGLLGAPSGLNTTTVVNDNTGVNGPDLQYNWPQIWVQDDGSQQGGAILVDNVGHFAGLYARMDRDNRGPQKAAAGIKFPFVSALDVERAGGSQMELVDDAGSQTLADSLINTVRIKGNPGGIVGWGCRTLSQDNRYRQAPVRRILQLIYLTSFTTLEGYTFDAIDPFGKLFSKLKGDLDTFLNSLWRNGTLYGNPSGRDPRPDDAYFVVCGPGNNPGTALQNGELHVDVAFVPTYTAERITENLILTTPGFIGRSQ